MLSMLSMLLTEYLILFTGLCLDSMNLENNSLKFVDYIFNNFFLSFMKGH